MARILYLDDEGALVLMVTRMLELLGHRAAGYTLAADALAAFRGDPAAFDIVLTDLSMPGMSGLDFAQQILAIRPTTRVAITTGHVDARDVAAARSLGVLQVVVKPHTIDDLSRTIGDLLREGDSQTGR